MAMMERDQKCGCKRPEPAETLPGVPLSSGFDWHERTCPKVNRAVLSPEAKARIQAKFDSVDEARRRAMEGAHSYVIG